MGIIPVNIKINRAYIFANNMPILSCLFVLPNSGKYVKNVRK